MALGDFHLHSTVSDGLASPADVVGMATSAGVRWMALTDHDTTAGLTEARLASRSLPLQVMPGIELSTDMDGIDCHLLALGLRWEDAGLQAWMADQREGRRARLERMVEILAREGAPIDVERVLAIAGEASVGRPHVARALVEKGHVATVAEAFDRWLGNGQAADVPREKLTPVEAINRVHALGGIVSVAHPPFMGEGYQDRIVRLASAGADALEVYYKHYPPDVVAALQETAERLGMAASGGSDYHGLGNPDDRPVGEIPFPDDAVRRFVEFCEDRCAIPWLEAPDDARS